MNFSAKQGILSQVTLTKETIISLHSRTADFSTDHFLNLLLPWIFDHVSNIHNYCTVRLHSKGQLGIFVDFKYID